MQKWAWISLLVTFLAILITAPTTEAQASVTPSHLVQLNLDGLPLATDVPPLAQNGRTYLPFRALAEGIGVTVSWDSDTKTVHASDGNSVVELTIDCQTARRNGVPIHLDAPPLATAGRTLVPVRFFAESFGAQVQWDPVTRCVLVTSPPSAIPVIGFYALGDSQSSSWSDLFDCSYPQTETGHTDLIGELALGWYSLDATGNLLTQSATGWQRPEGWENVLRAAERYGLRTAMVIHVTDADGHLSQLLGNPQAANQAVAAITAEAAKYHGVNLDFEGLGWREEGAALATTRANFTAFARHLAQSLAPLGRSLTLTLHAPNSAYRGYDYQALGALADRIIVMAYDYGTRPEPIDKVLQAVETAVQEVPSEKLVLGVSIPNETPESVQAKIGIAKRCRLGGLALWRLGLLSDGMWQALGDTVAPRSPSTPPV